MRDSNQRNDSHLLSLISFFLIKILVWIIYAWLVVLFINIFVILFLPHVDEQGYITHLLNSQLQFLTLFNKFDINHYFSYINSAMVIFLKNAGHEKILISIFGRGLSFILDFFKIMLVSGELVLARLTNIFFIFPTVLLTLFVFFIDGLVQRDIRKFSGGRESALIYHQAKSFSFFFLSNGIFIYLVLPISINADFILILAACLSSCFLLQTVKAFKKTF